MWLEQMLLEMFIIEMAVEFSPDWLLGAMIRFLPSPVDFHRGQMQAGAGHLLSMICLM
jgi:hypothetical protein